MNKKLLTFGVIGILSLFIFQTVLAQNETPARQAFNAFKSNINSIIILILILTVLVLVGKLFSVRDNGVILWIVLSVAIILVLAVILTDVL